MHPSEADALGERSHFAFWKAFAILGLTFAAYLPALRSGYIWDDDSYLTKNALVQSPGGLARIWMEPRASPQYYPLVFTSFWIEHRLWGLHPLGYHMVNVLLHAANAILIWRLLSRLAAPGAFLAGLMFALHPIHVESVAWITERKNVLSGFFYLSAAWAYLRYSLGKDIVERDKRKLYYGGSFMLFICALLSKSVTATLPAAILVILWWKRGRIVIREIVQLLPFFAVGISAAINTAWLEKHHVGAGEVAWGLSALDRILLAGRITWFYLGKLLWPAELIFFYPRWTIDAARWWQYLFPLGVIIAIVALWKLRHRFSRGPPAAGLFFCGTLIPVLGFVNVYPMIFSYVADHFQYLASIGPIAAICGAAAWLSSSRTALKESPLCYVAASVVLASCVALTWRRCGVYRNEETLWMDTINRNSQAWAAYNNLGMLMRESGRKDEALNMFRRAVQIDPRYVVALDNLGFSLLERHQDDEAFEMFERAVESDRYFASAQRNLGRMLSDRGRLDEGIIHLQAATLLQPDSFEPHEDLGNAYFKQGHVDKAIAEYREVLRIKPDYPLGLCNLGVALAADGKSADAVATLQQALALDDGLAVAHYTLGTLLAVQGMADEAISHFRKALKGQPHYPMAHQNLAVALAAQGRGAEAIEHFQQAVRQAPDDANIRFNLARALADQGRASEAIQEYREVLRINPGDQDARKALDAARKSAGKR